MHRGFHREFPPCLILHRQTEKNSLLPGCLTVSMIQDWPRCLRFYFAHLVTENPPKKFFLTPFFVLRPVENPLPTVDHWSKKGDIWNAWGLEVSKFQSLLVSKRASSHLKPAPAPRASCRPFSSTPHLFVCETSTCHKKAPLCVILIQELCGPGFCTVQADMIIYIYPCRNLWTHLQLQLHYIYITFMHYISYI